MIIRKTLASFVVFLSVIVTIPSMLIFAFDRTIFDNDFYPQKIAPATYHYVIKSVSDLLREESDFVRNAWTSDYLEREIKGVFSLVEYAESLKDFGNKLNQLKKESSAELSLDFSVLRNSLFTVSNNLIYEFYKALPSCMDEKQFYESIDYPVCVVKGMDYDLSVQKFTRDFELTIYGAIPEKIAGFSDLISKNEIDLKNILRNVFFVSLILLLGLIAVILYKSLSLIVFYQSLVFFISGSLGFILSLFLSDLSLFFIIGKNSLEPDQVFKNVLFELVSFVSDELLRVSLMFIVVGIAFILIYFFLYKTLDDKKNLIT